MEERGLVITKDYILKLELGKKIKVAVNLPLASITKLSISPEARNQVLVMSFNAKGQNDFVMSFVDNEDLIGELIGTLSSIYQKKLGRNLEIYTSNILTAQTGKNYKTISVSGPSGPNSTFFANKDGTITYSGWIFWLIVNERLCHVFLFLQLFDENIVFTLLYASS